jgi:hypothetical protein
MVIKILSDKEAAAKIILMEKTAIKKGPFKIS